MHVFTVSEGFRKRVELRATNHSGVLTGIARLASGALLVARGGMRAITPPPVGEVSRDSMTLGILDTKQSTVSWLDTFPGNAWLGYALPPGSAAVSNSLTRFIFAGSLIYAAGGNRVWIGDSESGRIRLFDANGRPVGATRAPWRSRRLSRPALEEARRQALESTTDPSAKARITAVYYQATGLGTAPFFARFVAGPNDELWIESFREAESASTEVVVLNRIGVPTATFDIPPRTMLLEAGDGYVLVLFRDQDDVEGVAVYQLRQ